MPEHNRLDRYWKLPGYKGDPLYTVKEIIEAAGYIVGKNPSKSMLHRRLHSIDRGLLVYDKCSTDELQSFLLARGLRLREKRDVVILALHRADQDLRFERFVELPPEMRTRIYDFYFAALPTKMRPGVQAPLTRTSTIIRAETLRLFYSTRVFELRFFLNDDVVRRDRSLLPANDVDLFLNKILEHNLHHVRKVHLLAAKTSRVDFDGDNTWLMPFLTCDMQITCDRAGCVIELQGWPAERDSIDKDAFENRIANMVVSAAGLSSEVIYETRRELERLLG